MNGPLLSIIIPVHNPGAMLTECLASLHIAGSEAIEVILVSDGCTDRSLEDVASFKIKVIKTGCRIGPARARNVGAAIASGSILLFLDSDVCVHADTIPRIRAQFAAAPNLAALIGSYDDAPAAPGLVSQYRNLLHYYMHQRARRSASTFWAGCGAIRAQVFKEFGGFAGVYKHPSVEDIELGYRLHAGGMKIQLDPEIQVKHLKRWRLCRMLKTDIVRRGVPWMKLILRDRRMPNDLNLRFDQRLSVALVYLSLLLASLSAGLPSGHGLGYLSLSAVAVVIALNSPFYVFLLRRRGVLMVLAALPLHCAYFLCNGASFVAGVAMYFYSHLLPTQTPARPSFETQTVQDIKTKS